MDAARVAVLREILAPTGWVERTREFAAALRASTSGPGGLLLVGTPDDEPWHLAAHLDDEARHAAIPELVPTLVRWRPPAGAPSHLSVGLDRLGTARRGESLVVVTPGDAPAPLLERVSDARRTGARVFAIDAGDAELRGLAHEAITVPEVGLVLPRADAARLVVPGLDRLDGLDLAAPAVSFDAVQHLVSAAAGEARGRARRRGARDRLARFLDIVSGPPPSRDP